ncbi:GNAT family N-acetyltransferase [Nocardioides sp. GCM10027113]|uniref:GNAT family N-acetyltransferase n=1 Tax=unclassified Nocardioides TaxID=2615069 RepID=UPI0036137C69
MTLATLEQYYDAAPRQFASVVEVGPFTVFVGPPGGWTFYARPRLGGSGPFDAAAVADLVARMRDLGVPETVEWVHDVTPDLLPAVLAEGSLDRVEELPLMVLREPVAPLAPEGVTVRMLGPHDEALLGPANGVSQLAFGPSREPAAGPAERDASGAQASDAARALLRAGRARIAVAEHPEHGVLATGRHLPHGGVSEVAGVATLPAMRGRGLASAVTAVLLEDAVRSGVGTVFLTAASDAVARLYHRLGFRRVGTGYAAARSATC